MKEADGPEKSADVHGVVEPYGPAKQTAPSTGAGPVTSTDRSPSGISQPLPMTFQYSSSPECCALAGLSRPSAVYSTW